MFPVICKLGPLSVNSYGVMLAIALLVCAYLAGKDAQKIGISSEVVFDLVFWSAIGGILGARLFYIALHVSFFVEYPSEIFQVWNGGLAWQGGFFAGTGIGIWFIKSKKLPLLKMLDLTAPYVALGQAIGRLGCFLNGCCFGREVSWGIYFPVHQASLHPTQLYATGGLFVIFLLLKNCQGKGFSQGVVFVFYILFASSLRFIIEFFRADHESLLMGLSIYQFVCLFLLGVGLYVHSKLNRQPRA